MAKVTRGWPQLGIEKVTRWHQERFGDIVTVGWPCGEGDLVAMVTENDLVVWWQVSGLVARSQRVTWWKRSQVEDLAVGAKVTEGDLVVWSQGVPWGWGQRSQRVQGSHWW